MSSHIDQLVADVEEATAMPGNASAHLDTLIHTFMAHYVGAADRQKVLLNELDNLPQAQRRVIVGKQRLIIAAVQGLLASLNPDLAADAARGRVRTMLLFGMINWTHTWYDPDGEVKAAEIADIVLKLIRRP